MCKTFSSAVRLLHVLTTALGPQLVLSVWSLLWLNIIKAPIYFFRNLGQLDFFLSDHLTLPSNFIIMVNSEKQEKIAGPWCWKLGQSHEKWASWTPRYHIYISFERDVNIVIVVCDSIFAETVGADSFDAIILCGLRHFLLSRIMASLPVVQCNTGTICEPTSVFGKVSLFQTCSHV